MSLSQGRAQEEGLGSGTAPVLLPPPVPQHSPAAGMAPGLPGAHGHSPSPEQGSPNPKRGTEGQKHPRCQALLGSLACLSFPSTAWPRSSSGQPQVMHKGVRCSSFGDPNPRSSTPQSPDTRVPTTHPHTARLLPTLVWGLINFWGKKGALMGALHPPGGAAALPECFPSANTGASASPTALHRGFVRPERSPFPSLPLPVPCAVPGRVGGIPNPYLPCPKVGNLLPTAVIGPAWLGERLCSGTGRSSGGCSLRAGTWGAAADPPPSRPSPPLALPSRPAGMCSRFPAPIPLPRPAPGTTRTPPSLSLPSPG